MASLNNCSRFTCLQIIGLVQHINFSLSLSICRQTIIRQVTENNIGSSSGGIKKACPALNQVQSK